MVKCRFVLGKARMKTGVTPMPVQGSKLRGGPIMSLRGHKPEAIASLVGRASCPSLSDRQDACPTRSSVGPASVPVAPKPAGTPALPPGSESGVTNDR